MSLSMVSTRNSLKSGVEIPKPSGIGLHLNSIVNAVQGGPVSKLNIRTTRRGNVSIVGGKISDSHLSEYSNLSSVSIDGNSHENHTSVGVTSPVPLSTCIVKALDGSDAFNSLEDQLIPGSKRKCTENVHDSEEFNKSSPQRKRMKSSDPVDSDGCKHCNCKRSKCLKLYCDCFASGIYCAGPCSCQGCFNKPEYEDIVLETRQKMESRDPLAFAPRVVKRSIQQPANSVGEDEYRFTPSSARHKRGCKCKKSMCLKKYCECYQSNVGCSDGCRCEGCQNVFGRKGEYCSMKDLFSEEDTNETADGLIPENCERTLSGNHTPLFDTNNLTPPSPAFQFSNLGKDASKAWFPSEEYSSQTPESNFTSSPYMISSDNNNSMISEDTQDIKILDLTTSDDESSTPNLLKCVDNLNPQSLSRKIHYYLPNTPVPQFSLTKLVWESDLSNNSFQDETPDILKDSSIPKNAVKVCSPNKKRVSPPHGRPHEFGSCSSTGLRTGRKFILKAVPSFPPLTHCIDSRSVPVQKANNPQNQGVKKLQIL